jgi:hypothetical protein
MHVTISQKGKGRGAVDMPAHRVSDGLTGLVNCALPPPEKQRNASHLSKLDFLIPDNLKRDNRIFHASHLSESGFLTPDQLKRDDSALSNLIGTFLGRGKSASQAVSIAPKKVPIKFDRAIVFFMLLTFLNLVF